MGIIEKFEERNAQTGLGSAIYIKLPSEEKYHFLIPVSNVPFPAGEQNSVEFKVTTSSTTGKLATDFTIEDKTFTFMAHRDNFKRLDALKDQTLDMLFVLGDYSGFKAQGTISYNVEDSDNDNPVNGTGKIICQTADPTPINDVRALIKKTCKFTSAINNDLVLSETKTLVLAVEPVEATISTKIVDSITGEVSTLATANVSGTTVTFTNANSGDATAYLTAEITATYSNYADWTTTVLLEVPVLG